MSVVALEVDHIFPCHDLITLLLQLGNFFTDFGMERSCVLLYVQRHCNNNELQQAKEKDCHIYLLFQLSRHHL